MISLILPVYNEADGILNFLNDLKTYLLTLNIYSFELLIINDGSTDGSEKILTSFHSSFPCRLIHFSRNFGKESAISAGLANAEGDVAIIMDSDFQHPFNLIPELIKAWQEEGYDMAYTIRSNRNDESMIKRIFSSVFYKIINTGDGPNLPVHAGDFRLLSRPVIDAILSCHEHVRFMKGLYAWVGFRSKAITYDVGARKYGKTKWSFFKLFRLAVEGITNFTDLPLRIWTLIGFVIAAFSLIYGLVNVISTLLYGVDTPGYPTLVSAIFFFGGIQLISIGVIGEYLSHIFREVKKRPTYIIKKIDKL